MLFSIKYSDSSVKGTRYSNVAITLKCEKHDNRGCQFSSHFVFFGVPKTRLAKTQKIFLRLRESFLILILAFSFSKFSFLQKTKPRTEAQVNYARTTCKLRASNAFNVRTCITASSFTKFTFFEKWTHT